MKDVGFALSAVVLLVVAALVLALVVILSVATHNTHDMRKSCETAGGVEVVAPEGRICILNTVVIKVVK